MDDATNRKVYDEESPLLARTDIANRDLETAASNLHNVNEPATTGTNSTEDESVSSIYGMKVIALPFSSRDSGSILSLENFDTDVVRFIRFQVVIWYVGRPDEVLGKVDMKFRVTLFWNCLDEQDEVVGYGRNNPDNKRVWKMHGRQRAYSTFIRDIGEKDRIVYVPPVSILNAVDFEILGEPEVCLLNSEEYLMKWSCLYKASLQQDNMHVAQFPHDSHDLVLRLGILKHRQPRKRWDKQKWKLDLATKYETEDTIEIPHGTIVDHVKVPGFSYKGAESLKFEFSPLAFGPDKAHVYNRDQCLQVHLPVTRESSYYDRNIIPLLAALNTAGICTLALQASVFDGRGEMILAIAFVEIGIRMTVDSRLPVVGYQIKMQWVLNNYFFGLLFLVAESALAYLLYLHGFGMVVKWVDLIAAILEFMHMLFVLMIYFLGSGTWLDRICCSMFKNMFRYN